MNEIERLKEENRELRKEISHLKQYIVWARKNSGFNMQKVPATPNPRPIINPWRLR